MTAFTPGTIESANLICLFINHNSSAGGIFANSNIKSAINLVKDFPVHIRYIGANDVLGERICRDDALFIKSIQKSLSFAFLCAFIYTKKLGMSVAFILECIKSRFDLIHKPRIVKYDTNRQKKPVSMLLSELVSRPSPFHFLRSIP